MPKISPWLWFEKEAEEAAYLYCSIFKNSKVLNVSRYGEGSPFPAGTAMTVTFEVEGQEVTGLNGGPSGFEHNESFSFFVSCDSQEEVDEYWNKLTADGGEESQCGWLKDKYGISWQIVPTRLGELLSDEDSEKAGRVMQAMLKMSKIDVAVLEAAYNGG